MKKLTLSFLISILLCLSFVNAQQRYYGPPQVIHWSPYNEYKSYDLAIISDFDNDGDNDVVYKYKYQDLTDRPIYKHIIAWKKNIDGLGSFGNQILIDSIGHIDLEFFVLSDIDNDLDKDIFFASSDGIYWMETILEPTCFSSLNTILETTLHIRAICSSDIDNDGDNDLVVACSYDPIVKVFWIENLDAQGNFGNQHTILEEYYPWSLDVGDIDQDDDVDVVIGGIDVSWVPNIDGTGNFGSPDIISLEGTWLELKLGDVNNDNNLDVIVAFRGGYDKLVWFDNIDGLGNYGPENHITNYDGSEGLLIYDVDNDNDKDVVLGLNQSASHGFYWFENIDGLGNFNEGNFILSYGGGNVSSLTNADIDSDGSSDLIATGKLDVDGSGYIEDAIYWLQNSIFDLVVLNPTAGESWWNGTTKVIKWNSNSVNHDLRIEYSVNNGNSYEPIINGFNATHDQYLWDLPEIDSDSCKVRFSCSHNDQIYIESEGVFSIYSCDVPFNRIEFYENVSASSNNPDNLISPSSTIRFKLQAENSYIQNLLTLHGEISSESPFVTITDNEGTFNNILQGENGWSFDEYEIQLSEDLPDDGMIEFTITMYDEIVTSETWISTFYIPFQTLSYALINDDNAADSDGNNNNKAESGETIEIVPVIENISYFPFYDAEIQLTSSNTSVWNNVNGASGEVFDHYPITDLPMIASSGGYIPEYDFVFDNSAASPSFVAYITNYAYDPAGYTWEDGGVLMKFGLPFTLQNGQPISGALLPIEGEVIQDNIKFYDGVDQSPENPQNLIAPGSKLRFKLMVENKTNRNLLALKGLISTGTDGITITDPLGAFNNIPKDEEAWSADEFEIQIGDQFPQSGEAYFTLTLSDPFMKDGSWEQEFLIPFLSFDNVVIDDDDNPDSDGNNNDIAEPGETIEIIPLIENKSQQIFYRASGQLVNPVAYITIWNEVEGASGLVYDTYKYNVVNTQHAPIQPGTTNVMPEEDFVFKHNGSGIYSLKFNLVTTTWAFDEEGNDGVKMIFGIPFEMNEAYPAEPIIITSPLEGTNIAQGESITIITDVNVVPPVYVVQVDYYIDNVLIGTDTDFPYSYSWNTTGYTTGEHIIKATLTDSENNKPSQEVTVNIMDVYYAIPNQYLNLNLPEDVFAGIPPENRIIEVSLIDGSQLPEWLHFNPPTMTFSGIAPQEYQELYIRVTVTEGTKTLIIYDFVLIVGDPGFGIDDLNSEQAMHVFPNPNTGKFKIEFLTHLSGSMIIFDLYGRIVREQNISSKYMDVDINEQPDGLYLMKVTSGDKVYSTKILKK